MINFICGIVLFSQNYKTFRFQSIAIKYSISSLKIATLHRQSVSIDRV